MHERIKQAIDHIERAKLHLESYNPRDKSEEDCKKVEEGIEKLEDLENLFK